MSCNFKKHYFEKSYSYIIFCLFFMIVFFVSPVFAKKCTFCTLERDHCGCIKTLTLMLSILDGKKQEQETGSGIWGFPTTVSHYSIDQGHGFSQGLAGAGSTLAGSPCSNIGIGLGRAAQVQQHNPGLSVAGLNLGRPRQLISGECTQVQLACGKNRIRGMGCNFAEMCRWVGFWSEAITSLRKILQAMIFNENALEVVNESNNFDSIVAEAFNQSTHETVYMWIYVPPDQPSGAAAQTSFTGWYILSISAQQGLMYILNNNNPSHPTYEIFSFNGMIEAFDKLNVPQEGIHAGYFRMKPTEG